MKRLFAIVSLLLLSLNGSAALDGGVAGLGVGLEAYTRPAGDDPFRVWIELEIYPTRGRFFVAAAYEVNPDLLSTNRLSLGVGYIFPLAERHGLRLELDCGMTYPLTHDWWSWKQRVERAWWGLGLDIRWHWEFTPGLALSCGLRPELAWRSGKASLPLTALVGLTVYP